MIAIDYTITIGNVLTFAGMVVAAITAVIWQRFQIDNKVDKKEIAKIAAELAAKAWQRDLDALRLELVRDFVSTGHLQSVEARMTAHMDAFASEIRGLRSDLIMVLRERSHHE